MSKKSDLLGKKYGRLLVISESPHAKNQGTRWLCMCECGNETIVYGNFLKRGLTKSCGCLHKEIAAKVNTIHGNSGKETTPEYTCWLAIKSRCYNENNPAYNNYGGRGIKVCDRWLESFENFYKDVGDRPTAKHSLDRYPNVNGDYEPNNVRWATEQQQQGNRRNNKWLEYNGKKMILQDWARLFNVNATAITDHLRRKSFAQTCEYYYNKNNMS